MRRPFMFFASCFLVLSLSVFSRASFLFGGERASHAAASEAVKLNNRGLEHLKKKEYDAAIQFFRQALQIQPDFSEALNNLGKALDAVGKDPEAIGDFDRALKLAPENAVIHGNKGLALFHEGKFEESIASYRRAIGIHDDFTEAYNGMGAALLSVGKTLKQLARSAKPSN